MTLTIQSITSPQTESLIGEFLASHHSGTLATADIIGIPHAAVVYYLPQPDYSLLFATKTETQKYKNIKENKQVAFVVYEEESQTTLQVQGHVEVVDDPKQQQAVLGNMTNSSLALSKRVLPPAEKLLAGDYIVLRLVPQVIKMIIYARPDSEGDDLYETLLFSDSKS